MDSKYKCCGFVRVTTVCSLLGHADLGTAIGILGWAVRHTASDGFTGISLMLWVLGFASTGFAVCMLYGVRTKRWRCLIVCILWQQIRIGLLIIGISTAWSNWEHDQLFWGLFTGAILFIGLMILNSIVLELCRKYFKSIEVLNSAVMELCSQYIKNTQDLNSTMVELCGQLRRNEGPPSS